MGKFAAAGAQGGTVFADPTFAKGMSNGKLTRSAIDRFTIVLMGGIAAESIQYGNSEVGLFEEGRGVLVGLLVGRLCLFFGWFGVFLLVI